MSQLPKIEIPDIEGKSKDELYWFQVKNLNLKDLEVTRKNIKAYMVGGRILRIQIMNLNVEMKDVLWQIKQLSWPRLKAKGKAKATVTGLSVRLVLRLDKRPEEGAKWEFVSTGKKVIIGRLKMKIQKSSVSWVANSIIWLFNNRIRIYTAIEIEKLIAWKVEEVINTLNQLIGPHGIQKVIEKKIMKRMKNKKSFDFAVVNRYVEMDDKSRKNVITKKRNLERDLAVGFNLGITACCNHNRNIDSNASLDGYGFDLDESNEHDVSEHDRSLPNSFEIHETPDLDLKGLLD